VYLEAVRWERGTRTHMRPLSTAGVVLSLSLVRFGPRCSTRSLFLHCLRLFRARRHFAFICQPSWLIPSLSEQLDRPFAQDANQHGRSSWCRLAGEMKRDTAGIKIPSSSSLRSHFHITNLVYSGVSDIYIFLFTSVGSNCSLSNWLSGGTVFYGRELPAAG